MTDTKRLPPITYQAIPKPGQLTAALLGGWLRAGRELASWWGVR